MDNYAILYSGGMDSFVLLNEYKDHIKLAISFNYGSKHNNMEYKYAKEICKNLGIPHIRLDLRSIFKYFKSDLLQSGGDIPEGHYADESMKSTVVPFRNGIMLSIAAGICESYNIDKILIANHFGDHSIYPDCRENFIYHINKAIKEGTYKSIEIKAPYTTFTKRDIGLKGKQLGLDFSKSYSCYKGHKHHCGKCGTCIERKEALEGFDITAYED